MKFQNWLWRYSVTSCQSHFFQFFSRRGCYPQPAQKNCGHETYLIPFKFNIEIWGSYLLLFQSLFSSPLKGPIHKIHVIRDELDFVDAKNRLNWFLIFVCGSVCTLGCQRLCCVGETQTQISPNMSPQSRTLIISHLFTKMSQALAFFLGKIVTEKAEGLARPSLWSHLLQSPPVSTTIKGSRKQCRLHLRQAGPHDENTVWFESRTSDPTLRNTSTIQWCVAERFAFISITSRTWEV